MLGGPYTPNGDSNWPLRLSGGVERGSLPIMDLPLSAWVISTVLQRPGFDRCRRMADMQHEGAAADRGAVDPCRLDAEIMADLLRGLDRGGEAIDVGEFQAGIRNRIQRRVRVQLDLRHVRDDAELGGLGRADDGNLVSAHGAYPFAGRNRGRVILSSSFSNLTSTFMSSSSASGVCGQSTMLVIMRGPSSSSTTAME